MPKRAFDPEPASTLGRDFAVFREPGFLITLAILLLLSGLVAGVLVYSNMEYGIPPF